ncbi:AEC family transporter [Psychromonas ossibalaenae]|uniref:AEC family transporter n=1 Tax=Psychromonas ossibalaenae TaxID=444922 RepID=UPI000371F608|nr:AEC family transporter [Psychromonas ossibalaenae]
MFAESLIFSFSVTGPICLMLFLGWFLKHIHLINEAFIDTASKLAYQVTLPALLFLSIVNADKNTVISISYISYSLAANLLFFLLTIVLIKRFIKDKQDHGVIIQGSFRANTAIIGLAYAANVYGESGVALAAVYVAFVTVLYNILAVIVLTQGQAGISTRRLAGVFTSIAKNPLIISIFIGVICFSLTLRIPPLVSQTGQYFADMTLPLALLCTGASLNLQELQSGRRSAWFAASLKLVLAPLLITGCAYLLGFSEIEIGLLFFMSGAPTAAASYVMARSMGGNANLAANIIAVTTAGSLLSCSIGISVLYALDIM